MFPARLENRREGPGPPEERGLPREFDDFLLFSIMSSRDMSRAVVVIFSITFLPLSLAERTRSRRQNCGNREREGLEEEREARVSSHHHYLIISS